VARNGNILNIWTLDLSSGELKQFTDAVGGNWSPTVLNEGKSNRIAFVSYFKNEYSIRTLERKEPLHTAATSDFGAPGPIIDFQAPLQHTLVKQNTRKKGVFEKMFLEGRPPVNVGVTSNGGNITVSQFAGDQARYRITLRLEAQNLTNHDNYAGYSGTLTSPFFGQPTAVNNPRRVDIGVMFNF